MDWPTTILLIVIIGAITSTIQAFIMRDRRRDRVGSPGAGAGRHEEEMRALRERVAVLERIATERNHALELEFDRLRER